MEGERENSGHKVYRTPHCLTKISKMLSGNHSHLLMHIKHKSWLFAYYIIPLNIIQAWQNMELPNKSTFPSFLFLYVC
jgi:hypothetical protein